MSPSELDILFAVSQPGPIPDGPMDGTVLLSAHTHLAYTIGRLIRRYVWKGKTFDAANGRLLNRFPTLHPVSATMSLGPSLLDHNPCIVLNYSQSHALVRHVRDELRSVAPGLYLGIAYQSNRPLVHFALTTKDDDGHV